MSSRTEISYRQLSRLTSSNHFGRSDGVAIFELLRLYELLKAPGFVSVEIISAYLAQIVLRQTELLLHLRRNRIADFGVSGCDLGIEWI